ncbi:MAG: aminodeoxychorismate/anthranilate synthase component II [Alphaproteobacteria bacterium]|nr:aminodeoxychorismate/anthranilate synthase component II [Alphaproteobacteria bacterium]|tara:strand:- start:203 stop:781 length:579 start_codon:yes stop_codon:yes gene_type:complete
MLVLIDNYDSFTYNLVHYFEEIGQRVKVFRNDEVSTKDIFDFDPNYIVISPGPSTPRNSGICIDLIKENSMINRPKPLLGVCLGHQAIAEAFGGNVIQSGKPIHGKVSKINHFKSNLFKNIKTPFNATRYHSLIVQKESLPECLEVTAITKNKIIMAIQHKKLPIFGVQFHPESIATDFGHQLLKNFLSLKK